MPDVQGGLPHWALVHDPREEVRPEQGTTGGGRPVPQRRARLRTRAQ